MSGKGTPGPGMARSRPGGGVGVLRPWNGRGGELEWEQGAAPSRVLSTL